MLGSEASPYKTNDLSKGEQKEEDQKLSWIMDELTRVGEGGRKEERSRRRNWDLEEKGSSVSAERVELGF